MNLLPSPAIAGRPILRLSPPIAHGRLGWRPSPAPAAWLAPKCQSWIVLHTFGSFGLLESVELLDIYIYIYHIVDESWIHSGNILVIPGGFVIIQVFEKCIFTHRFSRQGPWAISPENRHNFRTGQGSPDAENLSGHHVIWHSAGWNTSCYPPGIPEIRQTIRSISQPCGLC